MAGFQEFWRGLQRGGGMSMGFGIVGYSLPQHDEYARQALYYMTRNYQRFEPDLEVGNLRKTPLRIIEPNVEAMASR